MSTRQVVTINGDFERERVATWAKNVAIGTVVEFRKKSRSTEQNAKLHAMLAEVSEQVVWYGRKLDIDDWKNLFTASLRHSDVVPGIDKGTVVPLGIKTSAMTIDEMSNLIELIYAFGSDPEHFVVFKDPKDNSNSGSDPSPEPDDASGPASEGDDVPPASSPSPSLSQSDLDWLIIVARMLWAATPNTGQTEDNLHLLNAQRLAIPVPEEVSRLARDKAGSIYARCKQTLMGEHPRAETLKYISGVAGCTENQILETK